MDQGEAVAFVERWVGAWNGHDLEGVLGRFTDDVTFTSPAAVQLLGGDGVIRGKGALRRYWAEGLRQVPDLHFEIVDYYVGVDVLVINYRNQRGGLACEVLCFDGALVDQGHGTYLGGELNPAGSTGN
jgi:hypothetical protein